MVATYELTLTPDHLRGRVNGAGLLIASGTAPLGALVGGLLLQALGAVATTWILTASTLAMATVATLSPALRKPPPLRRQPLPEDRGDTLLRPSCAVAAP